MNDDEFEIKDWEEIVSKVPEVFNETPEENRDHTKRMIIDLGRFFDKYGVLPLYINIKARKYADSEEFINECPNEHLFVIHNELTHSAYPNLYLTLRITQEFAVVEGSLREDKYELYEITAKLMELKEKAYDKYLEKQNRGET